MKNADRWNFGCSSDSWTSQSVKKGDNKWLSEHDLSGRSDCSLMIEVPVSHGIIERLMANGYIYTTCAHLFRWAGKKTRLFHVQQLLDAQHHSFSAGLSKLFLLVTEGQTEPQVQLGASDKTRGQIHIINTNLTKRKSNKALCVCWCCLFIWHDTTKTGVKVRLSHICNSRRQRAWLFTVLLIPLPSTNLPSYLHTRQNLELGFSCIAIHERQSTCTVRICLYF